MRMVACGGQAWCKVSACLDLGKPPCTAAAAQTGDKAAHCDHCMPRAHVLDRQSCGGANFCRRILAVSGEALPCVGSQQGFRHKPRQMLTCHALPCRHRNILQFYGVAVAGDEVMLITEVSCTPSGRGPPRTGCS